MAALIGGLDIDEALASLHSELNRDFAKTLLIVAEAAFMAAYLGNLPQQSQSD